MNFDTACSMAKQSGNGIIAGHFKKHWRGNTIVWHKSGKGFVCSKKKVFQGKEYTKIYYLVVAKDAQRKGIASELLNAILGDVLYVTEEGTPGAEALCVKNGFHRIAKKLNEFGTYDIYYARSLKKEENNGGATSYYDFEPGWTEAGDIIEGRKMNFNQGSMFKVAFCFNIGRHSATTYERELNKLIYFAKRELELIQ